MSMPKTKSKHHVHVTPEPWGVELHVPYGYANAQWQVIDLNSDHGDVLAIVDPDGIRPGLDDAAEGNAILMASAPIMLKALQAAAALFEKGHAISRFDWGKSCLRAEDIRELNELPGQIQAAIQKATVPGVPEINQREWQDILLALRAKLKSTTVKGGDREARTWRKDLQDLIWSVKQKHYDEINDADWTEIYYALDSVDNGGAALMEKIGPDGKRMWTGPGVDRG